MGETKESPEWLPSLTPRMFVITLLENGEEGDSIIETSYNVAENEIKYAAARLVQLASAKDITCYSIEVAPEAIREEN